MAPSCSLLHTPIDLARENTLDPEVKDWLAFAVQKVAELAVLARALNDGRASVRHVLDAASASVGSREPRARSTIPPSRREPRPLIRRCHAGHPLSDQAADPARQAESARLPHDDDRLVSADIGDSRKHVPIMARA